MNLATTRDIWECRWCDIRYWEVTGPTSFLPDVYGRQQKYCTCGRKLHRGSWRGGRNDGR